MASRDTVLLETVKTHRARLLAAFVFGELADRRVAGDNVRRLAGGVVVAAVACVACVAVSLVTSLLAGQAAARAEAERQRVLAGAGPATGTPYASDTFDRESRDGWGAAEVGGGWRLDAASVASVDGGAGQVAVPSGRTWGGFLPGAVRDSADVTAAFAVGGLGSDGEITVGLQPRRASSTADYRVTAVLTASGRVTVSLASRTEGEGVLPLSDAITLQDELEPGAPVWVRAQAYGASPTTVRAKVWTGSGAEPQSWTLTATDDHPGLQRPGTVGFSSALDEGSGSAPATLSVLDLVARPVAR